MTKRWFCRVLLVLLAVAASVRAAAQQPLQTAGQTRPLSATAVLHGVVVDARTGSPLRRARVAVRAGATVVASVLSDDVGEFRARVPPDGALSIRASKAGFAPTLAEISARQREAGPLRIAMARGAVITGRLVYPQGEPASVTLPLRVFPLDRPQPGLVYVSVDDTSRFRFGGLAAGRYVIAPQGTPELAALTTDTIVRSPLGLVTARVVEVAEGAEAVVDVILHDRPAMPVPAAGGGSAVVSGRVLDAAGQPVPDATVRVVAGEPGGSGSTVRTFTATGNGVPAMSGATTVTTDGTGRFVARGVKAGTVTVEASKRGHNLRGYGQSTPGMPPLPIDLDEGEEVSGIEIVLPRASAVEGIVVDERGEPLEEVEVRLRRVTVATPRGTGQWTARVTDDRGAFRLPGLEPGQYLLSATVPLETGTVDTVDARSAYVTMYYPGTTDIGGAIALQVAETEDVQNVVLALRRVPVVRLEGIAVTSTGAPFAGSVRLIPRTTPRVLDFRSVPSDANGGFAFDDVPPGEYVLRALPSSTPSREFAAEFGATPVVVTERASERVIVRTTPGSMLSGRILLEGGFEGQSLWGYSIRAVAVEDDSPPTGQSSVFGPVSSGSTFSLGRVAGAMRLMVSSTDAAWYLKSILINGVDAADTPFDFGYDGREYSDITVVFSGGAARISGVAVDERTGPVRTYAAIVFSVDRDRWFPGSRWLTLARADASGAFDVSGLPPGDYYVAAADRVQGTQQLGEWQDPEWLQSLIGEARRVTLGPGEVHRTSLRVIRR